MSTTFKVSQVEPSGRTVRTTTTREALERVLNTKVEACSNPDGGVVRPYGFHALIETVHRAFDEHRSLILSPDDIWLTIAQGLAACVNQDPEKYRKFFVDHDGQKQIRIRRDGFVLGDAGNDWQGCFPEFSARIREHIGDETHGLILCNFSTTGDLEKAASEVVLMDVVQAYFKYTIATMCGIPSITLAGTADDWEKLAVKARLLAEFEGLHWWLSKVFEVVDQFAAAARGDVELKWWANLYKAKAESGGIEANGHILKLVPYLRYSEDKTTVNPLLADASRRSGIRTSGLPQSLSCVPFMWDYLGTPHEYQFLAGHVGIALDFATDALRPVTGWAVRPKPQK